MRKIFLSYRRDDSSGSAGRLYDRLRTHFGKEQVFMDVNAIEAGADFVRTIEGTVGSCDVLIALLGREWLSSKDQDGRRRLDDPDDFVRLEIATALDRKILVIPALVGGARMPAAQELPGALQGLARRQALEIGDSRFHEDANRLISTLEKAFSDLKAKDTAWPPRPGKLRAESETKTSTDTVPKSSRRKASSPLLEPRWLLAMIGLVLVVIVGYLLQQPTPPGGPSATNGTLRMQVEPPDAAFSATLQREGEVDKRTTQEKAVLLGEGNYALTVAAPGYRNYTAPVQIVADTATFHTVLLEPLLPSAPEVPIRQRTDSGAAPTTIHRPVKQVHSAAPPSMEGLDETVSLKPSRLAPEVPQSKSNLETKRTPPRRTAAAAAPTTIHTPGEQSQKSETVELDSELTRWTSIRAGKSKVPFEEHLARYPSGRYADRARGRIAEFDKWASVQNRGDLSALRDFVESFQDGAFVGEAKNQIARLEKEEQKAKEGRDRKSVLALLERRGGLSEQGLEKPHGIPTLASTRRNPNAESFLQNCPFSASGVPANRPSSNFREYSAGDLLENHHDRIHGLTS